MKVIETLDLRKLWEVFDFHYLRPEELNEKEAVFMELKNHAYEDDWSLPRTITGWVYAAAWFDNMIEGQKGRRGATRLQWRPDMGLPIYLDGYHNENNGASLWFIPKVDLGGNWTWKIRTEIEYAERGQPSKCRLFAER